MAPSAAGLVFGWARVRSGGLAAPIALHVSWDLLSGVAYLTS